MISVEPVTPANLDSVCCSSKEIDIENRTPSFSCLILRSPKCQDMTGIWTFLKYTTDLQASILYKLCMVSLFSHHRRHRPRCYCCRRRHYRLSIISVV